MERARAQSCPKDSSGTEGRQVSLGRGACPLAKVNSMEEHSLGVGGNTGTVDGCKSGDWKDPGVIVQMKAGRERVCLATGL